MDFDDLFDGIDLGLGRSRRVRAVLRLLIGVVGTGLAAVGAWHTLGYRAGLPFRLAGALLFVFLAAFFLVNVTLGFRASWTWKGFVAAFVLLFVVRILFGA